MEMILFLPNKFIKLSMIKFTIKREMSAINETNEEKYTK